MAKIRRLISRTIIFGAALLYFCLSSAAGHCAADCTLQIELSTDSGIYLENADFLLVKVADAAVSGSTVTYHYTSDFSSCTTSESELFDVGAAQSIYQFIRQQSIAGLTGTTNSSGYLEFGGLTPGMYLYAQTNTVSPYARVNPALVCVPVYAGGVEQKVVKAEPKVGISPTMDVTVNITWNDDGSDRPDSITVGLYENGVLIDTVVLTPENNWSHTWIDIPQSYDYTVIQVGDPPGYKVTISQSGGSFTISYTTILIQTGQMKWPVPVLLLAGVFLIVVGLRMRRDADEE